MLRNGITVIAGKAAYLPGRVGGGDVESLLDSSLIYSISGTAESVRFCCSIIVGDNLFGGGPCASTGRAMLQNREVLAVVAKSFDRRFYWLSYTTKPLCVTVTEAIHKKIIAGVGLGLSIDLVNERICIGDPSRGAIDVPCTI